MSWLSVLEYSYLNQCESPWSKAQVPPQVYTSNNPTSLILDHPLMLSTGEGETVLSMFVLTTVGHT